MENDMTYIQGLAAVALSVCTFINYASAVEINKDNMLSPEIRSMVGNNPDKINALNKFAQQLKQTREIYSKANFKTAIDADSLLKVAAACNAPFNYTTTPRAYLIESITCHNDLSIK